MLTIKITILVWILFISGVIFKSNNDTNQIVNYNKIGSNFMVIQYTLFFTIFTASILIHIINSEIFPIFKNLKFLFPDFFYDYIIYQPIQIIGFGLTFFSFVMYLFTRKIFADNYYAFVGIIENQVICNKGPYKIIRHPLYTFQILMMIGTGLVFQNIMYIFLPFVFYFFYKTSKEEEQILTKNFDDYLYYIGKTKMFIPYLF